MFFSIVTTLLVVGLFLVLFLSRYKKDAFTLMQDIARSKNITITRKGLYHNDKWLMYIKNPKTWDMILRQGSLGLGQSYMLNYWTSDAIDELFYFIKQHNIDSRDIISFELLITKCWQWLWELVYNPQNPTAALEVGKRHYDIGNELYKYMLGDKMVYSCGYWKDFSGTDVAAAQIHKMDMICQKLQLQEGMTVLDVGCGWGELVKYMAQQYKVKVVGITISKEQVQYGTELCKDIPQVEIRFQDYRDVDQQFDRIVSVGMYEHVGIQNYRTFALKIKQCLKPQGLCLLHSIVCNLTTKRGDAWLNKYIFPNSMLPSMVQIAHSLEKIFVIEDAHNIGPHYDKTLMAWYRNFIKHWREIKSDRYDDDFKRMWSYYLLSCAGLFRARDLQVYQLVLSYTSCDRYKGRE